jgi:hypothetical protein
MIVSTALNLLIIPVLYLMARTLLPAKVTAVEAEAPAD